MVEKSFRFIAVIAAIARDRPESEKPLGRELTRINTNQENN